MNENEAKYYLLEHKPIVGFKTHNEALDVAINALSEIQQYRAIGTMEEVRMLKDYKELYDVYKLIGTIEEFRNLKYKKNVLPIANITINEEDMQKIVNEKIKEIELDIQKIRAKAIDEFAERLKDLIAKNVEDAENSNDLCCEIFQSEIDEIAEQMKAGGKNEND